MRYLHPEGHLTLVTWASGPKSAIVHASWSSNQNSQTETRTLNAETKGLLTDRIADCGGDHPDHRRDCYPEPIARAYCGERIVRGSVDSYAEHSADFIQFRLPHGGLC